MSTNVIAKETGDTSDYFASLLGKIRIWDDTELRQKGNWRRLVTASPRKGLTFTAHKTQISVFRTSDLIEAVRLNEDTDKTVEAKPGCAIVDIGADVQILSVCPSETYLFIADVTPAVRLYKIEPCFVPAIQLAKQIEIPALCMSMTWIDAESFTILTEGKQAFEWHNREGKLTKWSVTEPLIAMDICNTTSAWVTESNPSVVNISGRPSVDLSCVENLRYDPGDDLLVSAVRVLEYGKLVFLAVSRDSDNRTNMGMGFVTWNASTLDVSIYPEMHAINMNTDVMETEMLFNPSIVVNRVAKWKVWVVGFGEDTEVPLRLVLQDQKEIQFMSPYPPFTWPLSDDMDDCVMLGMGIDTSYKLKRQPETSSEAPARTCHVIISASDCGTLVLTAIGKDAEDVEEPVAVVPVTQALDDLSLQRQAVTAQETSMLENSESDVSTVEQDTSVTTDTASRSHDASAKVDEDREKLLVQQIVENYTRDVQEHVQQFNAVKRLQERTRVELTHAIELEGHVRCQLAKYKRNDPDPEIETTARLISRFHARIAVILGIFERFQFNINRHADSDRRVQLDIPATINELEREREVLQRNLSADDFLDEQELDAKIEEKLQGLENVPHEPDHFDQIRDLFEWTNPVPIITTVNSTSFAKENDTDQLWMPFAEDAQKNFLEADFQNLEALRLDESAYYVLDREDDGNGVRWLPADDQPHQSSQLEEDNSEKESSDFGICDEEEIGQIIQAIKELEETEHERQSTEQKPPDRTLEQRRIDSIFEERHQRRKTFDDDDGRYERSEVFTLPPLHQTTTLKQYTNNLGLQQRDEEAEKKREDLTSFSASVDPTPKTTTSQVETTTPSPSFVAVSESTPQPQQSPGYFQAAGFSAFGQPSTMRSSGIVPQLGSLAAPGQQSPSLPQGFGSFAQIRAGQQQQQNAFAALAQQQAPAPFAAVSQSRPPAFQVNMNARDAKLYEMRK